MPTAAPWPNSATVPGRGGGGWGGQTPRKTASHATFPVIVSLFKHGAQSHFHITHSLDIWRPRGIQTRHQNVTVLS